VNAGEKSQHGPNSPRPQDESHVKPKEALQVTFAPNDPPATSPLLIFLTPLRGRINEIIAVPHPLRRGHPETTHLSRRANQFAPFGGVGTSGMGFFANHGPRQGFRKTFLAKKKPYSCSRFSKRALIPQPPLRWATAPERRQKNIVRPRREGWSV